MPKAPTRVNGMALRHPALVLHWNGYLRLDTRLSLDRVPGLARRGVVANNSAIGLGGVRRVLFTAANKRRVAALLVLTMLAWAVALALMLVARSTLAADAAQAACPHCMGHHHAHHHATGCDDGARCALQSEQGSPAQVPGDLAAVEPPLAAGQHFLVPPPLHVSLPSGSAIAAIGPPPRLRFCILRI